MPAQTSGLAEPPVERRRLLVTIAWLGIPWAAFSGLSGAQSSRPLVDVWKSPNCGCCKDWIKHLETNGFQVRAFDLGNEAKRAELEKVAAAKLAQAQAVGEKLAGTTVKLTQKAGVDGRLFGSVTNHDIAEELAKNGFEVSKAQVRMPNGPIKTVGDSTVSVALHTDVVVEINVSVYGETA